MANKNKNNDGPSVSAAHTSRQMSMLFFLSVLRVNAYLSCACVLWPCGAFLWFYFTLLPWGSCLNCFPLFLTITVNVYYTQLHTSIVIFCRLAWVLLAFGSKHCWVNLSKMKNKLELHQRVCAFSVGSYLYIYSSIAIKCWSKRLNKCTLLLVFNNLISRFLYVKFKFTVYNVRWEMYGVLK